MRRNPCCVKYVIALDWIETALPLIQTAMVFQDGLCLGCDRGAGEPCEAGCSVAWLLAGFPVEPGAPGA